MTRSTPSRLETALGSVVAVWLVLSLVFSPVAIQKAGAEVHQPLFPLSAFADPLWHSAARSPSAPSHFCGVRTRCWPVANATASSPGDDAESPHAQVGLS
jgi:hypothetical protein